MQLDQKVARKPSYRISQRLRKCCKKCNISKKITASLEKRKLKRQIKRKTRKKKQSNLKKLLQKYVFLTINTKFITNNNYNFRCQYTNEEIENTFTENLIGDNFDISENRAKKFIYEILMAKYGIHGKY